MGEWRNQLGPAVELDKEGLVLGVRGLEKFRDRLPRAADLRGHTAARIEDNPYGDRRILATERDDLLRYFILRNLEGLAIERSDRSVEGISNKDWNQDNGRIYPYIGLGCGR